MKATTNQRAPEDRLCVGPSTSPAMSAHTPLSSATPLKFSSLTWHIDRSFWFKLSSLKLQVWKLDATPQPSTAFYTTPLRATDPGGLLELAAGAFDGTMYSFPLIIPHE